MKITKVEIMKIDCGVNWWHPVGCRIYTDEGIYGDGEAAIAYGTGSYAAFGMIRDLAPFMIGKDPLENEVIWNLLYKSTFWAQNGGPIIFSAISAFDVALWDIKGKYFGVPVYKLLGGKIRDQLRCYASQLQDGWIKPGPAKSVSDYVQNAKDAVSQGYDAIKIDFIAYDEQGNWIARNEQTGRLKPGLAKLVEARISAVREAIGSEVELIMENHSYSDAQTAVQLARIAEKYNIFCYEEPSTPTPKVTKYISEKVNLPIAHGERIYTRWQYAEYFENQSVQIIQPDIGNCGGITEVKKICDMAYVYDVGVQAHVCASTFAVAPSLHLECAIPNFVIHEHHVINLMDWNKELTIHDYQPVNGYIDIPELPGLGNEWSEKALRNCDKVVIE